MSTHYWVPNGEEITDDGSLSVTSHSCLLCKAESHVFIERGLHWSVWTEFYYPNGDWVQRFDLSTADRCPEKFDSGSWLPGAVEI